MKDLQRLAQHMIDGGLHFLNARDVVAVYDDGEISEAIAFNLAAVVAEQCDGQQSRLQQKKSGNAHHLVRRLPSKSMKVSNYARDAQPIWPH